MLFGMYTSWNFFPSRFIGFMPVWYIAAANVIGVGRKAWTWSARKSLRLSQSASSSMSLSVVPGWAAMKYGMTYCSLPASFENLSKSSLKRS